MARYPPWNGSTPRPSSTSSASGPAAGWRSSAWRTRRSGPLIAERTVDLTEGWPEPDTEVVLIAADAPADLAPLAELATKVRPNGAIWVVSRKGKSATLRDVEVIAAARDAGLVDNKVASFSPTHTALRLVIPRDRRPR